MTDFQNNLGISNYGGGVLRGGAVLAPMTIRCLFQFTEIHPSFKELFSSVRKSSEDAYSCAQKRCLWLDGNCMPPSGRVLKETTDGVDQVEERRLDRTVVWRSL